jgi:hypothetical protein
LYHTRHASPVHLIEAGGSSKLGFKITGGKKPLRLHLIEAGGSSKLGMEGEWQIQDFRSLWTSGADPA